MPITWSVSRSAWRPDRGGRSAGTGLRYRLRRRTYTCEESQCPYRCRMSFLTC